MTDITSLFSQLEIIQIILTGLIVGNVAAITLSVTGLRSMHSLASIVYRKNNPIVVKNRYRPQTIPFKVLESTYLMVFCFILSEITALYFLFGEIFGDLNKNPDLATLLIWVGIITFAAGIFITLIMYTLLFWHSFQKIPVKHPLNLNPQYSSISDIFKNP
jgi:uncharacterized BrkB/YihY/UPF0761 family membrane protein